MKGHTAHNRTVYAFLSCRTNWAGRRLGLRFCQEFVALRAQNLQKSLVTPNRFKDDALQRTCVKVGLFC
jgi:hypothetical protein